MSTDQSRSHPLLVIKIGSSTLTGVMDDGSEQLSHSHFKLLAGQIRALKKKGYNVIVVSSAAISAGMQIEAITQRPNRQSAMPELQRLASIGWRHIMNAWADALPDYTIAELLLTKSELMRSQETSELLRVIETQMRYGDIVIANENDAIAHSEIMYGDNDTLAASLAAKLNQYPAFASRVSLLILSDIEGVYRDVDDPTTLIRHIDTIDDYDDIALTTTTQSGTGGMKTKFTAARIAQAADVTTYITHGRTPQSIERTLDGEIGTRINGRLLIDRLRN